MPVHACRSAATTSSADASATAAAVTEVAIAAYADKQAQRTSCGAAAEPDRGEESNIGIRHLGLDAPKPVCHAPQPRPSVSNRGPCLGTSEVIIIYGVL